MHLTEYHVNFRVCTIQQNTPLPHFELHSYNSGLVFLNPREYGVRAWLFSYSHPASDSTPVPSPGDGDPANPGVFFGGSLAGHRVYPDIKLGLSGNVPDDADPWLQFPIFLDGTVINRRVHTRDRVRRFREHRPFTI